MSWDAAEVNDGFNRFGLWLKESCGRLALVGHNVRASNVRHFLELRKKVVFRGFAFR